MGLAHDHKSLPPLASLDFSPLVDAVMGQSPYFVCTELR
jgi:hypothetical protein